MTHEEQVKTLQWQLGEKLLQTEIAGNDLWARVAVTDWQTAGQIARDELGCEYFTFLSALDWLVNPNLDGEKTYAEDGPVTDPMVTITDSPERKAGGTSRFQIFARVYNVDDCIGLTLLADLDESLEVPTWTTIFRGADWHERETAEMFGIRFEGHPDLRHIYLPAEFEGHPLRKDYPLSARIVRPWPGLVDLEEMPAINEGGDDAN